MSLDDALMAELVRVIAEGIRLGLERDHVATRSAAPDRAADHVRSGARIRLEKDPTGRWAPAALVGASTLTAAEWALERARNIVMSLPDLHARDELAALGDTMRKRDLHLMIQPGRRFVCQVVMGMPPQHAAVASGATLPEAVTRGLAAADAWQDERTT